MEYISHEDYKKMMGKFQAEAPKGKLLKEGSNFDDEGEEHSLAVEKELEDLFKAGKIDHQTLNNALDYVADNDYELYAHDLGADYVLKQISGVEEGNAFTAGLAKTKKGGEFKVDGKSVKDTSNYDAPMSEASGDIEKLKQEIKTEYGHGGSILSFANPRELTRIAKISPKAAKALEAMNNMMPEDLEIEDLKPALKAKVEKIESSILRELGINIEELDEYQFDQMYPDDPGPFESKDFMDPDESYFTMAVADQLNDEAWGLSPEQMDAAEDYLEQHYYELQGSFANNHEVGGGSTKAARYIVDLIKKQSQDVDTTIKEFLVREDDVNWDRVDDEEAEENETDNGIEEGKDMEEGLNPAPFQATGPTIQTVEAKHNIAKLKAEERDQLKQYIETIKTVKEEISKMLNKTKMKEGGDNTNLIMKPTTVSEDEMEQGGDKHEAIEKALGAKHQVIHSAIDKIIQTVKDSGFSEGDAALFLQHEIEEKAKEYTMSQYDPQ
jgi:hypothetical protein